MINQLLKFYYRYKKNDFIHCFYPLFLFYILFYLSCSPSKPPIQIQPEPQIIEIKPKNNTIIKEKTKLSINIKNINQVKEVNFIINDSIIYTDKSYPYQYLWNTTLFLDQSKHLFFIEIITKTGKIITSKKYSYTINNTYYRPEKNNVIHVIYDKKKMEIKWEKSSDLDFFKYELFFSKNIKSKKTKIKEIFQQSKTTHSLLDFNPTIQNWFWIKTIDTTGLFTFGKGLSNKIDIPPDPTQLKNLYHDLGDYFLSWEKNENNDFKNYLIYESISKDFNTRKLISRIENINQTKFKIFLDNTKYYQVQIEDIWGLKSSSNTITGDFEHTIWGKNYSVLNTTQINLSSSKIYGSIPIEISYLTKLTHLALNANFLEGEIPSEIGNLKNLVFLDLSHNREIKGNIPPEIGKISTLEQLYLNHTNLSGSIPISIFYLTKLSHLGLSNNNLHGSIPFDINELKNLQYLNLSNNNLDGLIPSQICQLTNLLHLNLSSNNLYGKIPKEITGLRKIETIGLFNNMLEGEIPKGIQDLKTLKYLNLHNNELSGNIASWISKLNNLIYIRLDNNKLQGDIPENICSYNIDFNNSEYFNLKNNFFCPPYPNCIKNNIGIQKNCE